MVHRKIKEAPKGRFYIAKQNYTAQEVGELSLHTGDHVEGKITSENDNLVFMIDLVFIHENGFILS